MGPSVPNIVSTTTATTTNSSVNPIPEPPGSLVDRVSGGSDELRNCDNVVGDDYLNIGPTQAIAFWNSDYLLSNRDNLCTMGGIRFFDAVNETDPSNFDSSLLVVLLNSPPSARYVSESRVMLSTYIPVDAHIAANTANITN
ncbi:hypothetical protein VNI00_016347 [Paramarasmius palmivorus]|uniref:Uncharacterized protein n=1 Tax=Paramarasmius palmivorus TaxID=297713 RepID=A0AAW0BEP9_9AGAR